MKLSYNDKTGNNMVQSRSRNKEHLKFCKLYSVDKMACLLQLEFSFLHGFFRCKLPMEVVDMEVKVMSMQGTHIFKRDRTTQLTKCIPWTTKICPYPNIIKKMKTFLEWKIKWDHQSQCPHQTVSPDPHSQKLIQISTGLTRWKREKQYHQKGSSGQLSPGLL